VQALKNLIGAISRLAHFLKEQDKLVTRITRKMRQSGHHLDFTAFGQLSLLGSHFSLIREKQFFAKLGLPMILFRAIFLVSVLLLSASCERIRERTQQGSQSSNTEPTTEPTTAPTTALPASVHLAFGNPSNASDDTDNYLVVGNGSVFSYNESRGSVNWVSWRTTRGDLGNSIPRPDFRPDPRLPGYFQQIGYYDYSGSGYDRGHLVPSADRFANRKLNEETFMMTNIVPQRGALNRYPWEKLESHIRSQVWKQKFDAYQIAGG
jgi:DNA/RNA endonuclease G (NUC1)